MFNIGPGELIVILILALVLLGPEKLPEMARTVGKGMRELRRATEDLKDQVESEFYKLDEEKPKPTIRPPEGPRFAARRDAQPALPVAAVGAESQSSEAPAEPAPAREAPAAEAPQDPTKNG